MARRQKYPILSYQPLRLLFQVTYISSIIIRLPLWVIVSLVRPLRPLPQWTFRQTFMSRVLHALTDFGSRIGITETLSLEPGDEGDQFQVIQPSTLDVYQGPLASFPDTKPVKVGGTWYPRPLSKEDAPSKTVGLYFHGGAYVLGTGRKAQFGWGCSTLAARTDLDAVFAVQYRLAAYSGCSGFPAALQDAVTGYAFLLHDLQIPASQIVLAGDSAGANLVVALLRYIREFGDELRVPPPRCGVLVSPWVAPFDHDTSRNPRRATDYLPSSFLRWGAVAYAGHVPAAETHPYVTPLGNPFRAPAPIFASSGSAEIFFEDVGRWAEEMKAVEGNRIEFYEEVDACHDSMITSPALGFADSAHKVVDNIAAFMRRC
ncbi:alpha/beta hydrolase fold-3 domain-containing protein [Hypoxylon fragiforme]|uniref:alpha/beta hydrolase fold-3 domain-containing protein n=1 Tax=Hypoxylon fragiforme TaxID=63214 RepID=UPI0020C6F325|nr:alpha/beta hydrolase fold-3 domain-containing protein [Hypoxylon fragiforme]KAI2611422.1 alpha/beta hydrolase fold-3 domain-containing protein [Hypoxylon fragiforme]